MREHATDTERDPRVRITVDYAARLYADSLLAKKQADQTAEDARLVLLAAVERER